MDSSTVIILLSLVGVAGIVSAVWLMKSDDEKEAPAASKPEIAALHEPQVKPPKSGPSILGKLSALSQKLPKPKLSLKPSSGAKPPSTSIVKKLIDKIKSGKKGADTDDQPDTISMPNLKEYFGNQNAYEPSKDTAAEPAAPKPFDQKAGGTVSMRTSSTAKPDQPSLSKEEEKNIEREIDLTAELSELKEKYKNLEQLHKEKSAEFDETKVALKHEQDHRKEFNKVKDLLEKQIKDAKDKTRSIEVELANVQSERDSQRGRIMQLDEKVSRLEKELLEKGDKIDDLVKRLQTFASPTTAAKPPQREDTTDQKREIPLPTQPPSPHKPEGSEPQARKQSIAEAIEASIQGPPSPVTKKPEPKAAPQPVITDNKPEATTQKPPPAEQKPEFTLRLSEDYERDTDSANENKPDEPFLKLQPDVLSDSKQPAESGTNEKTEGKFSHLLEKKKQEISEHPPDSSGSNNPEADQNDSNKVNGKENS